MEPRLPLQPQPDDRRWHERGAAQHHRRARARPPARPLIGALPRALSRMRVRGRGARSPRRGRSGRGCPSARSPGSRRTACASRARPRRAGRRPRARLVAAPTRPAAITQRLLARRDDVDGRRRRCCRWGRRGAGSVRRLGATGRSASSSSWRSASGWSASWWSAVRGRRAPSRGRPGRCARRSGPGRGRGESSSWSSARSVRRCGRGGRGRAGERGAGRERHREHGLDEAAGARHRRRSTGAGRPRGRPAAATRRSTRGATRRRRGRRAAGPRR